MDNTGNTVFIFHFYGNTVTVIPHCDNGILQIVFQRSVNHGIQLGADSFIGLADASPDMPQCGTGVIG